MKTVTIGDFRLGIEADGKLRSLQAAGGHELLHQSDYRFDCGGGRVFTPAGWDECFPTIDTWRDSPVMGELIGWAPVLSCAQGCAVQVWANKMYRVSREFFSPAAGILEMTFSVTNLTSRNLEFLWASHALFTLHGLESVALPDGSRLDAFALDGSCSKTFAKAGSPVVMEWDWGVVRLESDQPHWGIWLNRGGWPAGQPAGFGCIGIEATNTAGEMPAGGHIGPGAVFTGNVRLACPPQ